MHQCSKPSTSILNRCCFRLSYRKKNLVVECFIMWISRKPIKTVPVFSFSVKSKSPLLNCSHFPDEGEEKRGQGEKRRKWESILYVSSNYITPILSSFISNVPSSSTSESMSLTSSFVAIIPRFFMTSSSSSVVMVWLLSTSKILNASLNSRMINRQALVGQQRCTVYWE